MAPNVVRAEPIIKHVFEVCHIWASAGITPPKFVGGPFYRLATVRSHVLQIEQMSEYVRTQERKRRSERQTDDDPRHPRNSGGTGGQAGVSAG
jgi:hypothetical protein